MKIKFIEFNIFENNLALLFVSIHSVSDVFVFTRDHNELFFFFHFFPFSFVSLLTIFVCHFVCAYLHLMCGPFCGGPHVWNEKPLNNHRMEIFGNFNDISVNSYAVQRTGNNSDGNLCRLWNFCCAKGKLLVQHAALKSFMCC